MNDFQITIEERKILEETINHWNNDIVKFLRLGIAINQRTYDNNSIWGNHKSDLIWPSGEDVKYLGGDCPLCKKYRRVNGSCVDCLYYRFYGCSCFSEKRIDNWKMFLNYPNLNSAEAVTNSLQRIINEAKMLEVI